jgi:hypothetical protein
MFVVATIGAVLGSVYSVRVASDYWSGQRYTGGITYGSWHDDRSGVPGDGGVEAVTSIAT